MRLSYFVVGLIMGLIFIASFSVFISEANVKYGVAYNDSKFDKYKESLEDINTTTSRIQNAVSGLAEGQDVGLTDIIGQYFQAGIGALFVTAKTFSTFLLVMGDAWQYIVGYTGGMGSYIWSGLIASVIILVFIGVITSIIVKFKS